VQVQHDGSAPRGTPLNLGPKSPTPLLIWVLETFDCKLRPNGYIERNGHNGEPIGNHHRSFEWCQRWPPTTSPSPQNGGSIWPQHTRMAISLQRVIRSTSCLVLGWGFRGRRIERRYLRFEQIQDGGHRHVGKISIGDISATGRPIHFMFCSRVGFSGTAGLMALFSIRTNLRWRRSWPPPSWIISNGHISATAHDVLI